MLNPPLRSHVLQRVVDRRGAIAMSAALVVLAGCDSGATDDRELYEVTGLVTLNGAPIEGATVTFVGGSPSMTAFATTDSDGRYKLRSSGGGLGTTAGTHRVTVSKVIRQEVPQIEQPDIDDPEYDPYNIPSDQQYAETEEPESLVPKRYSKSDESGLTANVEEQANEINFELVTN